LTRDCFADLDP